MTVNQKYNFVDQFTAVHTQNVERMWGTAKWRNKCHRGTNRDFLDSNLIEFMARQYATEDPFLWIVKAIADIFPPETVSYKRAKQTWGKKARATIPDKK